VDEREIDVLLTLAAELHFGRTAQRLHLSTAAVSQTVARLERRIGAPLFTRTSRRVALTDLGRSLVADVAPARARLDQAVAAAMDAARRIEGRLRVGYMSAAVGRELLVLVDSFQHERPATEVSITETTLLDLFGPLRAAEVDLGVLPLPVREDDLRVGTVVHAEPAVAALPRDHRLAGRAAVTTADLAGATALEVSGPPDYWRRTHAVGTPSRTHVTGFGELLALVEAGRGVAAVGAQCATYYPRPGLAYVPLTDAAPFEYATVTGTTAPTRAAAAFLAHVRRARPGARG
jgi:DNA-binding transcriptional LysR family regulator